MTVSLNGGYSGHSRMSRNGYHFATLKKKKTCFPCFSFSFPMNALGQLCLPFEKSVNQGNETKQRPQASLRPAVGFVWGVEVEQRVLCTWWATVCTELQS